MSVPRGIVALMNNKKRKADFIPASRSPHRPMVVHQQHVETFAEVPIPMTPEEIVQVPTIIQQERIIQQHVETFAEVPIPMTQEENINVPTIIQQERIIQQHVGTFAEVPIPMTPIIQHDVHWTKQPAQRVADVPFGVITSAYGPHFYYVDELLKAVETMSGMPAPSITRRRHYLYSF